MSALKICRICLRTEAKGYQFETYQLKYFYEEVMAVKVNSSDGLPQWFCYECAALLYKFHKFKEKCYMGQKYLKELLWKGPITYEAIYKIDCTTKQLCSNLKQICMTDQVKLFSTKDVRPVADIKVENSTQQYNSEGQSNTYLNHDQLKNLDTNLNTADYMKSVETKDNGINFLSEPGTPVSVVIVEDNKTSALKSEPIKTAKTKDLELSISLKEFNNKYLSEDNWKKINLTEDEAIKEFRAKADDPKYLDAAYKCGDCFKGFSKKEMLTRHMQSRHSIEQGPYECRFCRTRFKWNCLLRKHIQQHFTKYECLRCHIVFHLDTSALLHEEYHSGTTKKCVHCNEEFRHVTTYYTHVRTHRSAHVCVLCGASFVSKAGLRQHSRRKHPGGEVDSSGSDDSEPLETYCVRCDIRFETSKAYQEHLFHSDMHNEVIKEEQQDDVTITTNKKIMGKRLRAKITNELRKRNSDIDTLLPVKSKRRKRIKRKFKKPSTCHQCGKWFATQAACRRHHAAEHPRTSFYAPGDRHICELCGASLAPGSVAMHQNMHTRETVHACATCGRQFHSNVGLKRHLVTHTGEKPFACSLCEKRFTQSNSMKLHYRTFHLRQPYPKRIRKKKEQPNQTSELEGFEDESDTLPEPEVAAAGTEIQPLNPGIPPVGCDVTTGGVEGSEDENMHYLTLS